MARSLGSGASVIRVVLCWKVKKKKVPRGIWVEVYVRDMARSGISELSPGQFSFLPSLLLVVQMCFRLVHWFVVIKLLDYGLEALNFVKKNNQKHCKKSVKKSVISSTAEEADEIYDPLCSSKRAEEAIDESEIENDPDSKLELQKIALKNLCRHMVCANFPFFEFVGLLAKIVIIQTANDIPLVAKTNFSSYERFGRGKICVIFDSELISGLQYGYMKIEYGIEATSVESYIRFRGRDWDLFKFRLVLQIILKRLHSNCFKSRSFFSLESNWPLALRKDMIYVEFHFLEIVVLPDKKIIIHTDIDHPLVTKTNLYYYERFGGWNCSAFRNKKKNIAVASMDLANSIDDYNIDHEAVKQVGVGEQACVIIMMNMFIMFSFK